MKTIIIEKIARIIKNRKRLENALNVKITNRGKEVTIDGSPEQEYEAAQTIEALNFGFPYKDAISIPEEGLLLEIINIKDYTGKSNMERVRGRVIGKGGKALKTLSTLTECAIEMVDNKIGIIGSPENIKRATEAIIIIIKGGKHSAAYNELEHNFPKPVYDLGLRDAPTRTMEEYEEKLSKLKKDFDIEDEDFE